MSNLSEDRSTVETRIAKEKEAMLEALKQAPIVQVAARRADISRATYYRWRHEDPEFAKRADEAQRDGIRLINDVAESQIIASINERNMQASVFWLKHHHPDYKTRVEIEAVPHESEELTDEEKELVKEALRLAALPPVEKPKIIKQLKQHEKKTQREE